jgi:general stress protein YciG
VSKKDRGFASMDPVKRREIASKGGKSVPAKLRSFFRDRKLAQAAGKKGGVSVAPKNRSFSRDRALAVEAGRKGGRAAGE